jgi:hypothetical protein
MRKLTTALALLFFLLLAGNACATKDARITDITIDKQLNKPDDIATITVCVRNTGNETFNFPIGLAVGYGWVPYYFTGESCDVNCYTDGFGDYVYTGSINPAEEVCKYRNFKFNSNVFGVGKKYDIVAAVYNATYLHAYEALNVVGWRQAVLITSFDYPYIDSRSCNSGWGNVLEQKQCITPTITVPSVCPNKIVLYNAFVKYNFTCSGFWNLFSYNDNMIAVNETIDCNYLFNKETQYPSVSGSDYVQALSTPNGSSNQATQVGASEFVYCNAQPNVTIVPAYLNFSMNYQDAISWSFGINNTGNLPLNLEVSTSDWRWMCIKDSNNTWHTAPFWINVPAGSLYGIVVTFSPSGTTGFCTLTGLPESETNKTISTYIKVTDDYTATATQDIFVGAYCTCTQFSMGQCVNTTHRTVFRTCTPALCMPSTEIHPDDTCATEYVPIQPIPAINVTEWQSSGWGWLIPFMTPMFLSTFIISAISGGIAYLSKQWMIGGVAFLMFIIVLTVAGVYPLWLGIVVIILAGVAFATIASKVLAG